MELTEEEARYVVGVLLELRGMALNEVESYVDRHADTRWVCKDCHREVYYSQVDEDRTNGHAKTCPRKLRYAIIGRYERKFG